MRKYFLYPSMLMILFVACKHKEKDWDGIAQRIVEKECDCFKTAGLSFGVKVKKVFEEGIGKSPDSYLHRYDSLDYDSMEELKKYVAAVYDSASGLRNCLEKARNEQKERFSGKEMGELDSKRKSAALKNPGCSSVHYYESGAIASAKYTLENKKPDSSFSRLMPDSIPLRVVIIRHAEKPDSGLNLTCKGYNRSLVLPAVLVALFGVPDYTYVPAIRIGKSTNSVRMYQTIVPFAVRYGLVVNSKHGEKDSIGIDKDVLRKTGTVLIVWNSSDIPRIVKLLGIKKKNLKWNPADFDSIWVIDFVRTKKGRLKPKLIVTKENIDPSSDCK